MIIKNAHVARHGYNKGYLAYIAAYRALTGSHRERHAAALKAAKETRA